MVSQWEVNCSMARKQWRAGVMEGLSIPPLCPSACDLRQVHSSEMVFSSVKEGVLPSKSLRIKCDSINTS